MRLIFTIQLFLLSLSAWSYQSSLVNETELRWRLSNVPIQVVNNSKKISPISTQKIISTSIEQWNQVNTIKFKPLAVADNRISFLQDFSLYGSAVVGITELSYGDSGILNGASIYLNEQNYTFNTTPGLSLGSSLYLGDVVTHELGHFLGLSHSEVLDATMFYANFPGQSYLASDDVAGLRSKYASANYGKISGTIQGGNSVGVLGVHVQAISVSTGEVISAISGEDGKFEISGLAFEDQYFIYTSPLKNVASLPEYYSNVQNDFCPNSYVGSFFTTCDPENRGLPQSILIESENPTVDVGVVTINCSLSSSLSYDREKANTSFSRLEFFNSAEDEFPKAITGYFRTNDVSTSSFTGPDRFQLDLRNLSLEGQELLKIHLISQPFGNPLEYSMIVRRNGSPISNDPFVMTTNPFGTFTLDLMSMVPLSSNSSENLFEIDIRAKRLDNADLAKSIPDLTNFLNGRHLPYLLVTSLWGPGLSQKLNTQAKLSDNQACLDAPFTYSVAGNISTPKSQSEVSQSDPAAQAVAACGTIGQPPGGGMGGGLVAMALGFIFVIFASRGNKIRKNFLS